MTESKRKLVFLGVGDVARALALQAVDDFKLFGTTRSADRAQEILSLGIEPIVIDGFDKLSLGDVVPGQMAESLKETADSLKETADSLKETADSLKETADSMRELFSGASVVVSFPPDAESDSFASSLAAGAAGIVYISSTAVYGKAEGVINEDTAVDEETSQAKTRMDAERKWLDVGASVIRAPGIYGRGNGLHQRLLNGNYRLPGDGSNYVSRIHVDDLSSMILSALGSEQKQQVYLSGDLLPTTHREIVEWLVDRLKLPFPESMPLERCHYTQRGNRKVDSSRSLDSLKTVLKYPTYQEGYGRELEANGNR